MPKPSKESIRKATRPIRIHKITQKSAEYRGRIIEPMVTLEAVFEISISTHYCKPELLDEFLMGYMAASEKVNLQTKFNLFGSILKNHYADFIQDNPSFLREVDELITVRNHMAHRKHLPNQEEIDNFDGQTITLEWTKTKRGNISEDRLMLTETIVSEYEERIKAILEKARTVMNRICGPMKGHPSAGE